MKHSLTIAAVLVSLVASITQAEAQVRFGGQASFADDADFGVGGRVVIPLTSETGGFEVHASFDYFFPASFSGFGFDTDVTYWEMNGNLAHVFKLSNTPSVAPYAGAGINLARASGTVTVIGLGSASASDTQVGLNLLGGSQFPLGSVTPFVELKLEVSGGEQFVISGGVLFGG